MPNRSCVESLFAASVAKNVNIEEMVIILISLPFQKVCGIVWELNKKFCLTSMLCYYIFSREDEFLSIYAVKEKHPWLQFRYEVVVAE